MHMATVPYRHNHHQPRSASLEPSAIGGLVIVGIIAALVLVLALMIGCFAFKFLQGRSSRGVTHEQWLEHPPLDRRTSYPPSLIRFLNRHRKTSSDSLPLLGGTSPTRADQRVSPYQERDHDQVNHHDHSYPDTNATQINLPELSNSTTTTPSTSPSPPAIPEVPDRVYPPMSPDEPSKNKTQRLRLLPPIPTSSSSSQLDFRLSNHLPALIIPSSPTYNSPVASTTRLTPGSPNGTFSYDQYFSPEGEIDIPEQSMSSEPSPAFPPVPPLPPDHLELLERLDTVTISRLLKSRAKRAARKPPSRTSTQSSRLERLGSISSVLSSIDERLSDNDASLPGPTQSSRHERILDPADLDEKPPDSDMPDEEAQTAAPEKPPSESDQRFTSTTKAATVVRQPSGPRPPPRSRSKRPFVPPPPFIPPPNPQPRKPFPNTMGSVQASSEPPYPLRAVVSLASQQFPTPQSSWQDPIFTYSSTSATGTRSDDSHLRTATAPLRVKRYKTKSSMAKQSSTDSAPAYTIPPPRPVAGPRVRASRLSPIVSESHLEFEDHP